MLLTRPPLTLLKSNRGFHSISFVRLACVRHAASVHPEPGSNSQLKFDLDFSMLSLLTLFTCFMVLILFLRLLFVYYPFFIVHFVFCRFLATAFILYLCFFILSRTFFIFFKSFFVLFRCFFFALLSFIILSFLV